MVLNLGSPPPHPGIGPCLETCACYNPKGGGATPGWDLVGGSGVPLHLLRSSDSPTAAWSDPVSCVFRWRCPGIRPVAACGGKVVSLLNRMQMSLPQVASLHRESGFPGCGFERGHWWRPGTCRWLGLLSPKIDVWHLMSVRCFF